MIASIVFAVALYLSIVLVSKTIGAAVYKKPINVTNEAILTANSWALFYYLA